MFTPKKEVYKFDPKAQRNGKAEFSTLVLTKQLYKESIKNRKEYSHLTFEQFCDVWEKIVMEIKDEVVDNALGVNLAFYLGELKIQYVPYKMRTKDIAISTELGENTPQIRLKSKGKSGKIIWERKSARRYNRSLELYHFEPHNEFKGMAAKALDRNPDKYRVARIKANNLQPNYKKK